MILLLVKVLASSRQNNHIGRAKLADSSNILQPCSNGVRTGGFQNHGVRLAKKRKSAENSTLSDDVAEEKLKFPLYVFRTRWKR